MSEYNISNATASKLGFYVYLLVDPRNSEVFYAGKGKDARCLTHLAAVGSGKKAKCIRAIRKARLEPQIDILVHGLKDAKTAHKVEAAVIDLIGLTDLTNIFRGHGARTFGRRNLHDLLAEYNALPAKIDVPAILIRISKLYRPEMSNVELYDATRGFWKVGRKRKKARFAFAIYRDIVREVYEIVDWFPAGDTFTTRALAERKSSNRWEFIGRQAPPSIRSRFLSKSVSSYFPRGAQAPVIYVNCDERGT